MTDSPPTVERITGIYHADGSVLGELRYLWGKLRGTTHCGLCEVTHRGVRKKASFRTLAEGLPVPFDLVHLDERSDEIAAFTEGRTPAVVGHTAEGLVMLLGPAQLELGGDVDRFARALEDSLAQHGLAWSSPG